MKRILDYFEKKRRPFGFDLVIFLNSLFRGFRFYFRYLSAFKKQLKDNSDFPLTRHYFHQDMLIALKIFENVDTGYRTDGLVAHVVVFRESEVIGIRIQPQRIEFNSHRFFSINYLTNLFKQIGLTIFHLSMTRATYLKTVNSFLKTDNNFKCNYGCGIFEMTKI